MTFPMPYIADQSVCTTFATTGPSGAYNFTEGKISNIGGRIVVFPGSIGNVTGTKEYKALNWEVTTVKNCKEKATVFVFKQEQFTRSLSYLVYFGFSKAIFNFVCGVASDRFGRKGAFILGWLAIIPGPLMVMFATVWPVAAASSIFLGIQQAMSWSATIFIFVDLAGGSKRAGIAIGLNETIGYTFGAIMNIVAAALLDVNNPRYTS